MELYFVRHAVAAERAPDGSDAMRALTAEGIERMRSVAKGLRMLGVAPELLITSPYTRARETAEILAEELKLEVRLADLLAPGCNLTVLRTVLGPYKSAQRVMLVGHEPDFSGMIGMLTGGTQIEIKKAATCRVDVDALVPGGGMLIWLIPPRIMREIR